MHRTRLIYILLPALLVPVGASANPGGAADPPHPGGGVLVYLEPFPGEAARLRFRIDRISAIPEEGAELPLTQSLTEMGGGQPSRQTLLATASLPPGQYQGLLIRISAPSVDGEEGPVKLTAPTAPTRVDAPFVVRRLQAVVLSLRFLYQDSVEGGSGFNPVFTAQTATRPAVGRLALATNRGADSVTIFDKVSADVVGVIPTGRAPAGIALDQQGGRAYVAVSGEDAVIAIGLLEYAVIDRTILRGGDVPVELALTPDGETLLSTNVGSNTLSLIDASSLTETGRFEVGDRPGSVLVDPTGVRAYVFNVASSSISVIDVRNRRPVATISTEAGPFRGQFDQAGETLYVIHRLSSRLSVIDPVSLRVTNRVYVGPRATALTVDPRSNLVYLGRSGSGVIEVFDSSSFLPVDSFPVQADVSFLALDVEQNFLYALVPELREVQIVEIVGNRLRGRVEIGDEPYWVAVSGER